MNRLTYPNSFFKSSLNTLSLPSTCDGLARQFVTLYPDHPDPELLYYGFKAYAALYLGRRGEVFLNGQYVYANFFTTVVTNAQRLNLKPVCDFYAGYSGPVILSAGVTSGAAVTQRLRDPMVGPAKVFTLPGEDPEFRNTTLDHGEAERRLLINQPDLFSSSTKDTSLLACLCQGFHGGDFATGTWRGSGYMTSTEPHVVVVTSCSPECFGYLPEAFRLRSLVVSLPPSSTMAFVEPEPVDQGKLRAIRERFEHAMKQRARRIEVAPDAGRTFQAAVSGLGLLGVELAVKLAAIDVLLESGRLLTPSHANSAVAQVQKSTATKSTIISATRGERVKSQIWQALDHAAFEGLTLTDINRKLNRNESREDIHAALQNLKDSGRAYCDKSASKRGRPPERWYAVRE